MCVLSGVEGHTHDALSSLSVSLSLVNIPGVNGGWARARGCVGAF